jgi:drug/metabolite transporter (DMT)-like permease
VSPEAIGLALLAAVLHAGWNALVKDSHDPLLGVWSIIVVAAIGSLLAMPIVGLPQGDMRLLLATSVMLHVAYDVAMASAYRLTDLSVAYPVARGTASLLAGIGGALFLSDVLSPPMLVGIGLAVSGLLVLAASRIDPRGLLTALAAAVVLASFTLVDSAGARLTGSSLRFVVVLFPLHAVMETVAVLLRRRPRDLLNYVVTQRRRVVISGVAAPLSYLCALAAIERAPVGAVTALRETSVVLATIIGVWFLGERATRQRWLAVALISTAAMVLGSA